MRLAALIFLVGCVAAPAPEANGYDVQLFFQGVPLGTETVVGDPATVFVRRIEERTDQCTSGACDPTTVMPIALVSAKCDDVCTVTPVPTTDGSVALRTVGERACSTTLRVVVRSLVDGSEWQDGFPLAFRDPPLVRDLAPNVSVDNTSHEK